MASETPATNGIVVFVRCPHCLGHGRIMLSGVYADTLELLKRRGEITGAELAREVGCKATAMNNRLAALERHGLISSRRYGRERRYKIASRKESSRA